MVKDLSSLSVVKGSIPRSCVWKKSGASATEVSHSYAAGGNFVSYLINSSSTLVLGGEAIIKTPHEDMEDIK